MLTVGESGERRNESQGPRLIPPRLYLMEMAAIGGKDDASSAYACAPECMAGIVRHWHVVTTDSRLVR